MGPGKSKISPSIVFHWFGLTHAVPGALEQHTCFEQSLIPPDLYDLISAMPVPIVLMSVRLCGIQRLECVRLGQPQPYMCMCRCVPCCSPPSAATRGLCWMERLSHANPLPWRSTQACAGEAGADSCLGWKALHFEERLGWGRHQPGSGNAFKPQFRSAMENVLAKLFQNPRGK